MERFDILKDIAERTGGDIYLGVVGPVRTGKSTFIRRFMDLMVLPNIRNFHERERAKDELPQGGAGRTIMTTEPKFIPNEAVEIAVSEQLKLKVRLVDCVGYAVEGAQGFLDEEGPRMVRTPWLEDPIPFEEAAEFGTRKVIEEHSTIGIVVTTDGSITDLPRASYEDAENRVIAELADLGKPFVIIVNSKNPSGLDAVTLAAELSARYDVPAMPMDCQNMEQPVIIDLLKEALYMFPIREIAIDLPRWVEELPNNHWLYARFSDAVLEVVADVNRLRDVEPAALQLGEYEFVERSILQSIEPGEGSAAIELTCSHDLFYQVLSELSGFPIEGDHNLVGLISELSFAKHEYDKVAEALRNVKDTGYGLVSPGTDDIVFEQPELIRQGNRFGVKLTATAPSYHLIRANISAEVTPFVGTEKQGEEFVRYLAEEFEKDPDQIWETDFLGKSMHDLVREGLQSKLTKMPENAQEKLQETLTKILNEGSGGLICIIL
ncbi:MAG TPA: stage IV sporulation protein A [Firmicutes bacterium]|jgi:stage IV sporulation protein A|nr:stage IV sporulation protein A [Bacillota bacterium]